jgi:hypothetical protein
MFGSKSAGSADAICGPVRQRPSANSRRSVSMAATSAATLRGPAGTGPSLGAAEDNLPGELSNRRWRVTWT